MLTTELSVDAVALAVLCRKHGVAKLSLFGSVLRPDFEAGRSDIDVLVEFEPGASKSLFKLLNMERKLAELFANKIDFSTPGSLSKYFRDDVLAGAQVLYGAA